MSDLKDVVKEINEAQEKINEKIENNDECTEEENAYYTLYNKVIDLSKEILSLDSVVELFDKISKEINSDFSSELFSLISIAMTQSAIGTIVEYDTLLKNELTKQFEHYGEYLNNTSSIVNAHNLTIEKLSEEINDKFNNSIKNLESNILVINKRLSNIEKRLNIRDIESNL